MEPKQRRDADQPEMQPEQDRDNAGGYAQAAGTHTEGGLTTNVGFHNPGSPGDLMGTDPLPSAGGIGAQDPGAGGDTMGDDEGHDLGITNDEDTPTPLRVKRQNQDERRSSSGGNSTSW